MIAISLIAPNPFQPRHALSDDDIFELSRNILRVGLLKPLLVRVGRASQPDENHVGQAAESYRNPDTQLPLYQLISGHRRLAASIKAGLKEVPCIIRLAEDREMLELALIENLQRQNLNPIEEAEGYRSLMKMTGITQQNIAQRVNKSEAVVSQRMQLLNLPKYIQEAVVEKKLGVQAALEIGRIEDENRRQSLFSRAHKLSIEELKATVQKALEKRRVGRKRYEKRSADPVFKDIFKDLPPVKRVYKDIVTFRVTDEAEFIRTLKTVIERWEAADPVRLKLDPESHFEN